VAVQGVGHALDGVAADQDIDRKAGLMQPAKDVQGMMIQPGEWAGGKQQVEDDAIGHRGRGWHVADVSKGLGAPSPMREAT